jgi:hypothetical protein
MLHRFRPCFFERVLRFKTLCQSRKTHHSGSAADTDQPSLQHLHLCPSCPSVVQPLLAESRPLFAHLPHETALFLSGYGTRISPGSLGNWIKRLMRRCGIEMRGSCHLFRHSCATDMHRGGADIRYVQEMLGHARLETTQIYTHVHIDALREVHARCHPHGRLDETHDLYGRHGGTQPAREELSSKGAGKPVNSPIEMVVPSPRTLIGHDPVAEAAA